jgi:hypothetical protein
VTENEPSDEWQDAAIDLCAWAQQEGTPAFVVVGLHNQARYIGPQFPAELIAKWLRLLADQYEKLGPANRAVN